MEVGPRVVRRFVYSRGDRMWNLGHGMRGNAYPIRHVRRCAYVPRPKRGSGFRVCGSHFGFGFVNKTFCRRGTRFPGTAISAAMRSAATTTAPPPTTATCATTVPTGTAPAAEPPARRRPVAGTRGRADSVKIRYLDDGSTGGGQPSRIAHLIRPPHTTPAALKFPPPQ